MVYFFCFVLLFLTDATPKQRGVCLEAVRQERIDAEVWQCLQQNGVSWISQTPFGWQQDIHSPNIKLATSGRIFWGETDEGIRDTALQARHHGIQTMLKPHIWLHAWSGAIEMQSENDWQQWFASYTEFILHYAKLAQENQIECLVVGAELLKTISREKDWRKIIDEVRQVYTGKLTYAANWRDEFELIVFWDALDFIGVQAYFPLGDQIAPSVEDLQQQWQPWLEKMRAVSERFNKKIVITEIGYRSLYATHKEPWSWSTEGEENYKLQEKCYEAMFRALWRQDWIQGIYIWKWTPELHGKELSPRRRRDFTPQGKPAEDILRKWYLSN